MTFSPSSSRSGQGVTDDVNRAQLAGFQVRPAESPGPLSAHPSSDLVEINRSNSLFPSSPSTPGTARREAPAASFRTVGVQPEAVGMTTNEGKVARFYDVMWR